MTDERMGILGPLQVLDLADEKASFCSKLLGDLGARVIKIEKPGGDSSRGIGPFTHGASDLRESLFFSYNNDNKLGITLDLEQEEGRKIFLLLIEKTDVLVETFRSGYLEEVGLGFEVIRNLNPRLILASVTGFGQTGPHRQYKSCDLVASAYGGQMYVSGSPSTPPLNPFGEQSYYSASLFAAIGILLALRKRSQDGKGQHIDISLQECVASTLDHVMVRFFYEGVIAKRQGSLYWNNAFFTLPCKEGHVLIAPFQQWDVLVEWMASEGMAEDLREEKYGQEEYRLAHLEDILSVLKRWTLTHTYQELFEKGQLLRFPWAPILSPKEVLNNPQLWAREFFVETKHPEIRESISYPGSPYKFSYFPSCRRKRAPFIGEDNRQIYREELGLSDEELQRLSSLNVI